VFWYLCSRPERIRLYHNGEIFKVEVREVEDGEESEYWGWINFGDMNPDWAGNITNICLSKVQSDRCFPLGLGSWEVGHGRQVNLVVTEVVRR